MDALREMNRKLVIVVLGTLAVFGAFMVWIIAYGIMQGLGMNEDSAVGWSALVCLGVVILSLFSIVHFNNASKNRVEQVTVIREVIAPPPASQIPTPEMEPHTFLEQPGPPTASPISYRSMLLDGYHQEIPTSEEEDPTPPVAPPTSYRSMLTERDNEDAEIR